MELSQAAGRALLRLRPTCFYSSPLYRQQPSLLATRAFTTTRTLRREQQQPEAFMRQVREQQDQTREKDIHHDTSSAPASTPDAPAPKRTESYSELLDGALDLNKGVPTAASTRTSRFATPSAQQKHRVQPSTTSAKPPTNSFAELLDEFRPGNRPQSSNNTNRSSTRANNDLMTFDSILASTSELRKPSDPKPLNFVPGPHLGRTIDVEKYNGDVARAWRAFEANTVRMRVKSDFSSQKFHERPGLKRKRLHSQRWRRRFKEAFKGTVKMVVKMRKQGW